MSDTNECFFCGCFFTSEDARNSGVDVAYSQTYCSEICYNRDTEQMKQDVIAETKQDIINNPSIVEANVGGFNLKINTNIK